MKRKYTPPLRYWRWLWLAYTVKVLVAWPVGVVIVGPYWLAQVYITVADAWIDKMNSLWVKWLNRDRQRAVEDGYRW